MKEIPDKEIKNPLAIPVRTEILLEDNKILDIEITNIKGSIANPLSRQQLEDKFMDCTSFIGSESIQRNCFEWVLKIPDLSDIKHLTQILEEFPTVLNQ